MCRRPMLAVLGLLLQLLLLGGASHIDEATTASARRRLRAGRGGAAEAPWFSQYLGPGAVADMAQKKQAAAAVKKSTEDLALTAALGSEVAAQKAAEAEDAGSGEGADDGDDDDAAKAAEDPAAGRLASRCLTRCSGPKHDRHCETICDQLTEQTGLFSKGFKPSKLTILPIGEE